MAQPEPFRIVLPPEMARMVRDKVADGTYQSESDVIQEGLLALKERDLAVEHWLRTDVAEAYDKHRADPLGASSLDDAFKRIRARARKGYE